jgi:hypothetical protein
MPNVYIIIRRYGVRIRSTYYSMPRNVQEVSTSRPRKKKTLFRTPDAPAANSVRVDAPKPPVSLNQRTDSVVANTRATKAERNSKSAGVDALRRCVHAPDPSRSLSLLEVISTTDVLIKPMAWAAVLRDFDAG